MILDRRSTTPTWLPKWIVSTSGNGTTNKHQTRFLDGLWKEMRSYHVEARSSRAPEKRAVHSKASGATPPRTHLQIKMLADQLVGRSCQCAALSRRRLPCERALLANHTILFPFLRPTPLRSSVSLQVVVKIKISPQVRVLGVPRSATSAL